MQLTTGNISIDLPTGTKFHNSWFSTELTLDTPSCKRITLRLDEDGFTINETAPTTSEIQPLLVEIAQKCLDNGQKYNAMREVRNVTGCNVRSAKGFVEGMLPIVSQPTIAERVKGIEQAQGFDVAVAFFREQVGCDLESAKVFVESIAADCTKGLI